MTIGRLLREQADGIRERSSPQCKKNVGRDKSWVLRIFCSVYALASRRAATKASSSEPSRADWCSEAVIAAPSTSGSFFSMSAWKTEPQTIGTLAKMWAGMFSSFDLSQGFHQMMLAEESRAATSFTIPGYGSFQYIRVPFGLLGSPSSFGQLLTQIVGGLS